MRKTSGKMEKTKIPGIKPRKRKKGSRKGENGKVLIIGGSEDYAGCLALAGLAALRTGVDIVTIASPEKTGWAVQAMSPDLIVKKFKGNHFTEKHAGEIIKLAGNFDSVLIGSGIGLKSASFTRKVVRKINKPVVIDADGIKAVKLSDAKNAIFTPHKNEFRLLLRNSGIDEKKLQKSINGNVILLKGRVDRIISKGRERLNRTGSEGMTVGGTGDVLAGIAAGFLGQGYSPEDSAYAAAFLNGILGDLQKKKRGYSFIASDLVEDMKKLRRKKARKSAESSHCRH